MIDNSMASRSSGSSNSSSLLGIRTKEAFVLSEVKSTTMLEVAVADEGVCEGGKETAEELAKG